MKISIENRREYARTRSEWLRNASETFSVGGQAFDKEIAILGLLSDAEFVADYDGLIEAIEDFERVLACYRAGSRRFSSAIRAEVARRQAMC